MKADIGKKPDQPLSDLMQDEKGDSSGFLTKNSSD